MEVYKRGASKCLNEFLAKYSDIPWRNIVGLRNVVIHEYFGVDLENIWEIIINDLPALKEKVKNINIHGPYYKSV